MHEYHNVRFAVRLHQRTFPQALIQWISIFAQHNTGRQNAITQNPVQKVLPPMSYNINCRYYHFRQNQWPKYVRLKKELHRQVSVYMYILYSSTISIGNYSAFTSLSPNSGKSDKYLKLYNANTCMYASTALSHENRLTQKRGTKAQRRAIVWITGEAGQSGAPVFFWAQIIGLSLKKP